MKKRITILSLAILAAGAIAAAPLMFGNPMGRRGHGFGAHAGGGAHFAEGFILGRLAHLREELDLSDAQAEQIRAILEELREQNEPYREQLRGGMHDIAKTLIANPNDVATAQAKLDARASAEKALKTNVLQASSKALNVLTPEQRTKLAELVEKRAARMHKRFGR